MRDEVREKRRRKQCGWEEGENQSRLWYWEFDAKIDHLSKHKLWDLLSPSKNNPKSIKNKHLHCRDVVLLINYLQKKCAKSNKSALWCGFISYVFHLFLLTCLTQTLRHTSLSHNSFQKSWEDSLEVTAAFMCADRAITTKKRGFSTVSHTLILMSYRLRTPFGSNKSTLRGNELILHWKTAEHRAKATLQERSLCRLISTNI